MPYGQYYYVSRTILMLKTYDTNRLEFVKCLQSYSFILIINVCMLTLESAVKRSYVYVGPLWVFSPLSYCRNFQQSIELVEPRFCPFACLPPTKPL